MRIGVFFIKERLIIIACETFPYHTIIDIEQCFGIIFPFCSPLLTRHLKIFAAKKRVNCCLMLTNGYVIIGRKICSLLLSIFLTRGLLHFVEIVLCYGLDS